MTLHDSDLPLLRELRAARRAAMADDGFTRLTYSERLKSRIAADRERGLQRALTDAALVALECHEAGGVTFNGRADFGGRAMWLLTDAETGSTFSFPAETIPTSAAIRREADRVRRRFAREATEVPA